MSSRNIFKVVHSDISVIVEIILRVSFALQYAHFFSKAKRKVTGQHSWPVTFLELTYIISARRGAIIQCLIDGLMTSQQPARAGNDIIT